MPTDIRSFFGGGGGTGKPAPKAAPNGSAKKPTKPAPKQRGRRVISDDDDDDDDDEIVQSKAKKPSTPQKGKPAARESKAAEETTSSAYFASSKEKKQQTTPIRSKPAAAAAAATTNGTKATPTKNVISSAPSSARRSARKTAAKNYAEDGAGDATAILKDDDEGDDNIFADNFKSRRQADDYDEGSESEDVKINVRTRAVNGRSKKPQQNDNEDEDSDIEMAQIPPHDGAADKQKKAPAASATRRKRKSKDLDDDEDEDSFLDDDDTAPKKKAKKTTNSSAPKPRGAPAKKAEKVQDSAEIQKILDNIPTVRAPTPPPRDPDQKFTFKPGGGNAGAAPLDAGSLEIPTGEENCLAGLTFVFTGVLTSLGREEGQNLVKQYGGKVTGAPSKKTSYVVLGADAGPKKLETIRKLGIKTIDETGLSALIKNLPANGGDSSAGAAYAEKQAKEEDKIRKQAEEMEAREREREKRAAREAKAAAAARPSGTPATPKPKKSVDDRLWVDKYAPDALSSVCGNKAQVEGLQRWLRGWPKALKSGFKHAGPDAKGIFRAAMLHGPPGVGKTTAAHLVAKLEGYDVLESNASDTRNKKLLEAGLTGVLDTTSLLGYFAGDGQKVDPSKRKLLLIMDEVDGMSGGDRGGVGAMAAVAKKTQIPMILICNDRKLPKMKPFDFVTADFPFRRPTTDMIRGRIATICFREGMKLPAPVLNALIEGCGGDIRQIINMISTIKLDKKEDMNFQDGKDMSKAWEKHVILKPWDIVSKILRASMFAESSKATLNDKTELYFNDHEFSFLMLQENYLKTQPSLASNYSGRERDYKLLELIDNAASSISDGDMVDRMIHGTQQQWSLMPTHAIFSFVRPASYVYGNFNTQVGFASWLGQNSKQGKLSRFVKEIQGHMRLRTSADRHEIRQQYLPALHRNTIGRLETEGKESVQDIIDFMDSYYLTKDDYDAIQELGLGPLDMERKNKPTIDAATKATFTRLYNAQSHPMPFVKASGVLGMVGGGKAKKDKPDLEEAVEGSADEAEAVEEPADDDEGDIKKDKYIKAPKKKPAAKKGAAAGKRAKGDDDDNDDKSDEKPAKKARGGGKAAARGRPRGKA